MEPDIQEIVKYYLENKTDIQKTAKLYNIDRKYLSKYLKECYPNYIIIQFCNIAKKIHNNKYDYSKVTFKNLREKIIITCPVHGKFEQVAFSHKIGIGCLQCGYNKTASAKINTLEQFVEKARKVHGDKYDYNNTSVIGNRNKIKIVCKIHGEFTQNPDDHKQGKGCLKCARENIGWNKTRWEKKGNGRIAKAYVIRCWNENEEFIKIGRTFNTIKRRFGTKKELPYKWEILKVFESSDYQEIWDKETNFHRKFKEFKYKPSIKFQGDTECFTLSEEVKNYFELNYIYE